MRSNIPIPPESLLNLNADDVINEIGIVAEPGIDSVLKPQATPIELNADFMDSLSLTSEYDTDLYHQLSNLQILDDFGNVIETDDILAEDGENDSQLFLN